MRSRMCSSIRIMVSAAMIAIPTTAPLRAQSPQATDTAIAIRELTVEIRTLRSAIERTSESQLQSQVLGLYLNLQQNRVAQATARHDGFMRELEGLTNRDRELAQAAATGDLALTQETDPAKRRAMEQEQRAMKEEAERVSVQLQQVRTREAEASQSAQTEEARWTELISRLEQLLKK
jgi:hypothetical protein